MVDKLSKYTGKEPIECSNCSEEIETGDEYAVLEDGQVLCAECYDCAFPKCEFCENRVPEDEMKYWGDCYCCPDCYEDFNPTFDSNTNEEETTEAYETMLKKYIGKKSCSIKNDTVVLKAEYCDCGLVTYKLEVHFDENGIVSDISRLTAEIQLSESANSSSWDSYIIRNADYKNKVPAMMLKLDLKD